VPRESVAVGGGGGGVNVIYGSAGGLTDVGDQFWSQDSPGIKEVAEFGDFLGASLAAADFGKGPHADLAVGAPLESATLDASGGVNVIYGSAGGLTEVGDQFWTQDSPGIQEAAEPSDSFGRSLAAADFGKSIHADLAVGVPGESSAGIPEGGGVNVIYGTAGGLTEAGDQFWSQDSPGVKGVAKPFDHFGRALSSVAVGSGAGS
jgi:hypothetical protein